MVARNRCCHCRYSSNIALSSGCLVTSMIISRAGRGAVFCFFCNLGLAFLRGELLYSSPGAPSSAPHLNCAGSDGNGVGPPFREIHVPRAWRVYFAFRFDFCEKKIVFVLGWSEPEFAVNLLPCHLTMKERWWRLFFPNLCVRIKDNNSSPHGKFHRFLFPFCSKFSDLNLTPYVLYIYLCYVTCHTQWAWVTYGPTCREA